MAKKKIGLCALVAFALGLAVSGFGLAGADTASAQSEAQPLQHDDDRHHPRPCGYTQCYGDDQCCYNAHTYQWYCAHHCDHH